VAAIQELVAFALKEEPGVPPRRCVARNQPLRVAGGEVGIVGGAMVSRAPILHGRPAFKLAWRS
jgi:hypothetical protein